jgi:hypothetical protein
MLSSTPSPCQPINLFMTGRRSNRGNTPQLLTASCGTRLPRPFASAILQPPGGPYRCKSRVWPFAAVVSRPNVRFNLAADEAAAANPLRSISVCYANGRAYWTLFPYNADVATRIVVTSMEYSRR